MPWGKGNGGRGGEGMVMHAVSRDPRYRLDFAVRIRVCEINRATFDGTISWGRLGGMENLSVESDRAVSSSSINRPKVARIGTDLGIVNPSSALNPHDRWTSTYNGALRSKVERECAHLNADGIRSSFYSPRCFCGRIFYRIEKMYRLPLYMAI